MKSKRWIDGSCTRKQGIEYAAVYNRTFYMSHNIDYKLETLTEEECFEHFLSVGIPEGRVGSASFNLDAYRNNYPELYELLGMDNRAYYQHYLEYGMKAGLSGRYDVYCGICYRKVFDVYYYREMNPDIQMTLGDCLEKYIEHFLEYGMNEGRMACETFDVHAYKYRYDKAYGKELQDLKAYYMQYLEQGQSLPITGTCSVHGTVDYAPVYSYAYYKANNSDIRAVLGNNASLYIQHFVEHGMQEGRTGNGIFNVYQYKLDNPQLVEKLGEYLPLYYLDYIEKK